MKRLCTILTLVSAACLQAACGVTTGSPALDLRLADVALTKPAADPVAVPERQLSQAEVENYWNADALNLRVCKADKAAIAGFYRDQIMGLRKGLAGQ